MRAVQFSQYGPPDVVETAEVPEPHAGPGAIRIAVRASGLTAGETYIRAGMLRDVVPVPFPYRTGFDAAGVVDEVGDGVTGVAVGDEVFGMAAPEVRGANADHAVLAAWAPKPAAWSWAEAGGAAGNVETSVRVLDRLGAGDGDTVLVQGASGAVGAAAVQIAVARGARVIGTGSARHHDYLRSLGAEPIAYGEGLVERVRALGRVDAVFDCSGGALPDLVAIAGDPGRVVTIADFHAAEHGVHMSHSAPGDEPDASIGSADPIAVHALDQAVKLAAEGRLHMRVGATFPLTEAASAHELSETRHAGGKIVLLH